MDDDRRLTLIGTGHVFQIEHTIREAILALRPDVVFVELDRARLQGLLHRRRTGESPPARGNWIHRRLHAFQEQVAKRYGGEVGGEMIAAVEEAGLVGAQVALIDRPAEVTVQRTLKALTWREKGRALGLLLGGGVRSLFPGKRPDIDAEVEKYQNDPLAALAELEGRFPSVHRVVIAERDALMARHIRRAMQDHRNGVAVVGDGHVAGMEALLSDLSPETFRLPEVRAGRLPRSWTVAPGGTDASYSVDVSFDPPQSS